LLGVDGGLGEERGYLYNWNGRLRMNKCDEEDVYENICTIERIIMYNRTRPTRIQDTRLVHLTRK
jgi:hypothetical protein